MVEVILDNRGITFPNMSVTDVPEWWPVYQIFGQLIKQVTAQVSAWLLA